MLVRRCHLALLACLLAAACSKKPANGSDGGPQVTAPLAPTLTAKSMPLPRAVALTWTPADALASSFEILRSDGGGSFHPIGTAAAGATTFSDTHAGIGTAYAYKVTANNAAGISPASNEVDVLATTSAAQVAGSDTRLIIGWTAVDNATSYDVYRIVSGAPQLLGTAPSNAMVDDGSLLPLSTNSTYSYAIVSKASGVVSSVASNVANGTTLGIDVVLKGIFISDTGEDSRDLAPGVRLEARNIDGGPLLSPDGGSPIVYESAADNEQVVVPGVPHGTYAITVTGNRDYAITSARSLDFSQAVMGRSDNQIASSGTTITYDVTALSPWIEADDAGFGDMIESISQGAGDFAENLALDVPAAPDAGATIFAGTEKLGFDRDPDLIDATKNDAYHLFQLHAQSSGAGFPYLLPTGVLSKAVTLADASDTAISGALSPTSRIPIADLNFPLGAWLDSGHAQLNPLARNAQQTVSIEIETGFAAHGWYGQPADGMIANIPQDAGSVALDGGTNVDLGALAWSNPAASTWDPFVLVESAYDVPFQISFIDDTKSPPATVSGKTVFTSVSFSTSPLGGSFDNGALVPTLAAPLAPKLNGSSLFAMQTNVSPTSRLSWSPPGNGTASYYLVVVHAIVPERDDTGGFILDAQGNYLVDIEEACSFTTKELSVALAADLLPAGDSFFATIDAISSTGPGGAIDGTRSPYLLGANYSSFETVTAVFTVDASAFAVRASRNASRERARIGSAGKGLRERARSRWKMHRIFH